MDIPKQPEKFVKYQCLGNDFILFDWRTVPSSLISESLTHPSWPSMIRRVCDRHRGVGADAVLILSPQSTMCEVIVFNADGSRAEMCMNGLSCAAHSLYLSDAHSARQISMHIGSRSVLCEILDDCSQHKATVASLHSRGDLQETISLPTSIGDLSGHVVSVGNPHFVLLRPCTKEWLLTHGKEIESHNAFPLRTNVDCIWPAKHDDFLSLREPPDKMYHLLTYERGCGMTLACGSGVAASLWTLFCQRQVLHNECIAFIQPGGVARALVDSNENISVQLPVEKVFSGCLSS